jgi:trigger factor
MTVSSSIEVVGPIQKKVLITVPKQHVDNKINEAITRLAPRTSIKGFRPGKAPRHLIEKKHWNSVREDVVTEVMREALFASIKENSLEFVGNPHISFVTNTPESDLEFSATLWTEPQVVVSDYEGIEVKVPFKVEVTDDVVNQHIEEFKRRYATLASVEDRTVVIDGDVVAARVKVMVDGKVKAGPEDTRFKVGIKAYGEEVDQALIGTPIHQQIDVTTSITLKERQGDRTYDNARVFITVTELFLQVLPELTDDFVKEKSGKASLSTVEELTSFIRNSREADAESNHRDIVMSKILDHILKVHPFDISPPQIEAEALEVARESQYAKYFAERKGVGELAVMMFGVPAERRIKGSYVLMAVAKDKGFEATDDDVRQFLVEKAPHLSLSDREALMKDDSRREVVKAQFLRLKALDLLIDSARVEFSDEVTTPALDANEGYREFSMEDGEMEEEALRESESEVLPHE